tara:strand:+ start:1546 stop:2229 length:684 start_codon:yes stop_codon:yes gene_type:complete
VSDISDKHPHVRGYGMAGSRSRTRLLQRLEALGVHDSRVLEAMARVPRHSFVDEAMTSRAYDDTALPIGYGQTISQPFVVAQMSTHVLAGATPPTRVLEIGTGCGYQAAVLAELVAEVYTVERIEALYDQARRRLADLGYRNVRPRLAMDGVLGLPNYAPFDVIIVTAGAARLPEALYEQLADGGHMIVPVGESASQRLALVRRQGDHFAVEYRDAVSFVPLIEGTR